MNKNTQRTDRTDQATNLTIGSLTIEHLDTVMWSPKISTQRASWQLVSPPVRLPILTASASQTTSDRLHLNYLQSDFDVQKSLVNGPIT